MKGKNMDKNFPEQSAKEFGDALVLDAPMLDEAELENTSGGSGGLGGNPIPKSIQIGEPFQIQLLKPFRAEDL
jgi:hypothetical protein